MSFWNNDKSPPLQYGRHGTSRCSELVEFATTVMTMLPGVHHLRHEPQGLGALRDRETVEIQIQGIGKMAGRGTGCERERGLVWGSTPPDGGRAAHRPRRCSFRKEQKPA